MLACLVLGLCTSMVFAFLACGLEGTVLFGCRTTDIRTGTSSTLADGRRWDWIIYSGWAMDSVCSIPSTAENDPWQKTLDYYPKSPCPRWARASEPLESDLRLPDTVDGLYPTFSDAAFGWPARCASYRVDYTHVVPRDPLSLEVRASSSTPLSRAVIEPRLILGEWKYTLLAENNWHSGYWATHVIWPGLIINGSTFAGCFGAAGLVVRFCREAVVARRRRRHECIGCGYAKCASSARCPECGLLQGEIGGEHAALS